MSELKQLPRQETIDLLNEYQEKSNYYSKEKDRLFELRILLKEQRTVLSLAYAETKSGMAQTIIDSEIEGIDKQLITAREEEELAINNMNYFKEVARAFEAALKKF